MKKTVLFSAALVSLGTFATAAQAEELGRVLSTTPVMQQVGVPRQVCNTAQVATPSGPSGAGAIMGAIAGGALGNGIGNGSGRAAATALGLVGGALLGNSIEGNRGTQIENVQQCSTQTYYENRIVSYNVTYEYAGKQYTVQMPQDPGPYVRLQVTPVGGSAPPPMAPYPAPYPAPRSQYTPSEPATVVSSAYVQPIVQTTWVQPYIQPAVVYGTPVYRPSYHPPVGISLNLGYVHRSGGHRHRGHWR